MKIHFFRTFLGCAFILGWTTNMFANDSILPYEVQGKDRVLVVSKQLHKSQIAGIIKAFAASGATVSFSEMQYTADGYFQYGTIQIKTQVSEGELRINEGDPRSFFPKIIYTTESGALGLGVFERKELGDAKVKISKELLTYYQDQFPLILFNGKPSTKQEIDEAFKNCNEPRCIEAVQQIRAISPEKSQRLYGRSNPNGTIVIEL